MCQGEEPRAGFAGRLIFRPETQETGNEDQERIAVGFPGYNSNDRFLPSANFLLDDPDCGMDLIMTHRRSSREIRTSWGIAGREERQ